MSLPWRFATAMVFAALLLFPWTGSAQEKDEKREKPRVTTTDGVELFAHFYPCQDPKVKNPPTILMLHPLGTGENSAKKAWVALARTLQEKAAVMTFDFRGHGQSTDVDPAMFWKLAANVSGIKDGAKAKQNMKQTINFSEFEKAYYPALVNDIYACKSFLDRKSDSTSGSACNTSSFILLGAESGATLGAIWLNAEWHRHKFKVNPNWVATATGTAPGIIYPRAEGQDVIACIWLTMSSTLGPRDVTTARTVNVASTLAIPLKFGTPTVFFYGENDSKGRTAAKNALANISSKLKKTTHAWTDAVEVKKTDLRGVDLLTKSLGVDRAIFGYLFGDTDRNGVIQAKHENWAEREFRKTEYRWRMPTVPIEAGANVPVPPNSALFLPAKTDLYPNDFVFDLFAKYIK